MNESIKKAIESICDDIATNTNADDNRKRTESVICLTFSGLFVPEKIENDEGAVILEDSIEHTDYSEAIKELKAFRDSEKQRKERTIRKVEQALGLKLYDWQKDFIFYDKPYGFEVSFTRQTGKTLAHCLRLCLSEGEPIVATLTPPTIAENEFLQYLGEDGCTIHRSNLFINELKHVYHTLLAAGNIDLREITFSR